MVNIFGQIVIEKAGQSKMQFDKSGLPVGFYALSLRSDGHLKMFERIGKE